MRDEVFVYELMEFLQKSPTPFHAVAALADLFTAEGFTRVEEWDAWTLAPDQRFFVIRNNGAFIAVDPGSRPFIPEASGFHIVGAHTDSPCLKLKPVPLIHRNGYILADTETYGGLLMNTWFDRDLSLAGRVTGRDKNGTPASRLIDFKVPIAVIPSLAIHLNREVNKNKSVNPQKELLPILMADTDEEKTGDITPLIMQQMKKEYPDSPLADILDHDLFFYDCQPPTRCGIKGKFLTGARFDNLLSCYCAAEALMRTRSRGPAVLVLNNHEEVGSASTTGAQGNFLKSVLMRLCSDTPDTLARAMARSTFISTDNAHGIHPNYPEVHDTNHKPVLNHGPVIKINASQRYATDSETAARIRIIAKNHGIPLQTFVMRSDMACGSTIGPITATEVGIKTADIGVPTFAMHSIRETAGINDGAYLRDLLAAFWAEST